MSVLDASIWVGWLYPQDAHHAVTLGWLRLYLRRGGLVAGPSLVLAEVAGAIARRTNDPRLGQRVADYIARLRLMQFEPVDMALAQHATRLAWSLRLRGADAVYVALAQQLGVPLITWDNEQLTRGVAAAAVYTPATAPPLP